VRPLSRVRIWSPRAASRERFVDEMQARVGARLEAAASAEEAVSAADMIVLVTSSPTPVIEDAWVSPGTHVVSVGACRPDHREMAPALVARARVFVDSRAGALAESGDIVQGIAEGRFDAGHLAGEVGELALGRVTGRRTPDEITIFKSLGMAVEDVVAADLVFQRAVETGAGTTLVL
jgi:ornithine cyclodeaminase